MDDVKVSHVNMSVVSDIIKYMQQEFGNITVSRGNSQTYLGMDIEFLKNRRISITMKRYIKKLLDMLPGVVKGTTTSPTKKDMFDVDTTSRALNKKSADLFHSVIAKILWITKRGRTDLETAESFLCTRVANPIEDDWQKLERLLRFISRTRKNKRIIGIHNIRTMNTFTDAS